MRIEQRLKMLADENPNYSLLWAQWEFDKKLLSRALNTVSRDFPHYSLHDASHSSTIITQIEKVIAPNIEKLSATDCWLLLESCYWHDAGMIITSEDKNKLLASSSFLHYLKELSIMDHELSSYAKEIIQRKDEDDIVKALKISNALTFIIADYFRSRHSERSGLNVNEPERINVFSPRTSLIPQRLFNFVALITQCHGKKRESIIELAKYNDGMDAEDYAHPRYVAALLRIGDLLDIDDGRFCPTLLHNIGDVPQSSLDHQGKHASIKSLFINSEIIEIRAVCENYGSYHAQQAWFNYIQDEFDYQKRIWNEIVPNNDYRALPTIGVLNCDIKGYVAIDGKVPKLTLDPKRVYDYITGSHIYSERFPFIRELIQNAVDATIYKVWDELLFSDFNISVSEEMIREEFNKRLLECFIDISFEEVDNDNNNLIFFSVRDFGTGMCLDDIKKILVVGSESIEFRKRLNRDMPDWAKPSGYFGIGLQSVFRLCEKVIIKTKMPDNPCFEVTVENESISNFYNIGIKQIEDKRFLGTKIIAFFKENVISQLKNEKSSYGMIRQGFDPLNPSTANVFHTNLIRVLSDDFDGCNINLRFDGKEFVSETKKVKDVLSTNNGLTITDYEMGIDISLFIDIESDYYGTVDYRYKGVGFNIPNPILGLSGQLDIFKNNAAYWLTINRKKGRSDREDELYEMQRHIINKHTDYLRKNTVDQAQADYLIYAYTGQTVSDCWRTYQIGDIEVSRYLNGECEFACHIDRYIYTHERNSMSMDSLKVTLLADIALRENVSITISMGDLVKKRKPKKDITDRSSRLYNLSFCNDGKSLFECDLQIIKRDIIQDGRYAWGRQCFPCYSNEFEDVSVLKDELPEQIFFYLPINRWAKRFLLSPLLSAGKVNNDMDKELDVVYSYFIRKSLIKIDESEFKRKYMNVWREVGFFD